MQLSFSRHYFTYWVLLLGLWWGHCHTYMATGSKRAKWVWLPCEYSSVVCVMWVMHPLWNLCVMMMHLCRCVRRSIATGYHLGYSYNSLWMLQMLMLWMLVYVHVHGGETMSQWTCMRAWCGIGCNGRCRPPSWCRWPTSSNDVRLNWKRMTRMYWHMKDASLESWYMS